MQRNMKDNKTKRHERTSFIATNHYPDSNVTADNIRPYVYPGCNTCQPDEDIMSAFSITTDCHPGYDVLTFGLSIMCIYYHLSSLNTLIIHIVVI